MADLESRVSAIEERLGMQEGLRASQDRDLGDIKISLRANTHLVQALSITQSAHTESLRRVIDVLDQHSAALAELTMGHQELKQGQQVIVDLLTTLIDKE